MKLQGINIANLKRLREYFSPEEALNNIQLFLRDCAPDKFYYTEDEAELYRCISFCEMQRQAGIHQGCALGEKDGRKGILWKPENEEIFIPLDGNNWAILEKMKQDQKLEEYPMLWMECLALCQLAGYECTSGELEGLLKSRSPSLQAKPEEKTETEEKREREEKAEATLEREEELEDKLPERAAAYETEQGITFDESVDHYTFEQWAPWQDMTKFKIQTKRLICQSYSCYADSIEFQVIDGTGRIIPNVQETLLHERYANFIGGKLVEFLPEESWFQDISIEREWDSDGRAQLIRRRPGKPDFVYKNSRELETMSSFQTMEDGGFIGISEGELLGYTSEVSLPPLQGKKAVRICARDGLYAVLTEDGEVIANFSVPKELFVTICMDREGYFYGLSRQGKIITNRSDKEKEIRALGSSVWIGCNPSGTALRIRRENGRMDEIDL